MIVIVVVVSFSSPGDDAISGLRLPDWTELCNRGDSSIARSSRSYWDITCSSLASVAGLFGKLLSKLASVKTTRDLTQSFHRIYMRPDAGLSLIFPSAPRRIHVESPSFMRIIEAELMKSFTRTRQETVSNQADTPSFHSTSTALPSSRHGLPRLSSRIELLLPQGPSA